MLLIVTHHYLVNSGLVSVMAQSPASVKSLFLYILGAWGKTGINCFVMITGYYMCKSHITVKKFLKLFLQILFYNVVISLTFIIAGYTPYPLRHMIKEMNPIGSINTGFVSCYLMFFLLIPFLNVLIKNLSQRQHFLLIAIVLFIYSVLGTTPKVPVTMNYVSWFCVLYFIASYIRLYSFYKKDNVSFWGWLTLVLILFAIVSVVFMALTANYLGKGVNHIYYFMTDSNKPFPLLIGISSFLFFKGIKIPQSRLINTVAASTFGVLLIHANSDTMRHWLWQSVCNNVGMYSTDLVYIHAVIVPLLVFSVCAFIDFLRIRTIESPSVKFFLPYAEKLRKCFYIIEDRIK